MTPRDLLYWLAGALDLGGVASLERAGEAGAESIRKHAKLALTTSPGDSLALTIYALVDQPAALDRVVRAHLLDVTSKMSTPSPRELPQGVDPGELVALMEAARKARADKGLPALGPDVRYC